MSSIQKDSFYFKSSNGKSDIFTIAYVPRGEKKGYIQFVHDTYEHIECYADVMQKMAQEGYIVFGHDHIGHGKSVSELSQLGKFDTKNAFLDIITDTSLAFINIFNKYAPEKQETYTARVLEKEGRSTVEKIVERVKPPIHAMIGIGFGAAIVKNYSIMYNDVNCVILVGDKGFSSMDKLLELECKKEIRKYGEDGYSQKIIQKIEKDYLKDKDSSYRFSWRTSYQKRLYEYKMDELNQFEYTLKSLSEILRIENSLTMASWVDAYPMYLTTYLICGKSDPVSKNTKAISKLVYYLKQNEAKNFFYKYYEGFHNLFFEKNRDNIIFDILTIINAVRNQQYKNIY